MAIRCHSSFVHYNMFHNRCGGGGNNFGTIFNITNNCNGGHTSFWGGLGAGLGYGLGGLFGGLFGGFGNMFGMGGMGFGNFGGFGNMFGMGGMGNLWGGGFVDRGYTPERTRSSERTSERSSGREHTETVKEVKTPNADAESITALSERVAKVIDKINKGEDVSNDEIQKLRDDINARLKGTFDGIQDDLDKRDLEAELEKLKNLKGSSNVVNSNDDEITIGGQNKKIADLTINDIEGMTEDEINGLTPEKAEAILTKLGYIGDDGVGKMSNKYKVLLLLQKSGVNVKVEHRSASQDQWIAGPLSNVANTDGKLSYNVDCSKCSTATIRGKYSFNATDNTNTKYTCTAADSTTGNRVTIANVEVLYKGEQQPLENESGMPLVKVK